MRDVGLNVKRPPAEYLGVFSKETTNLVKQHFYCKSMPPLIFEPSTMLQYIDSNRSKRRLACNNIL